MYFRNGVVTNVFDKQDLDKSKTESFKLEAREYITSFEGQAGTKADAMEFITSNVTTINPILAILISWLVG